jgi:hypothetical protein
MRNNRLESTAITTKQEREQTERLLTLQMWADWYTLLRAEQVYHTASDFSLSAVRWSSTPKQSWTIQGVVVGNNNGTTTTTTLRLKEDWSSSADEFPPRLIDRVGDELNYCNDDPSSTSTKNKVLLLSEEEYKAKLQLTLALARRRQQIHPIDSLFSVNKT